MTSLFLSVYLLIWPLIVAAVLTVIIRAFGREWAAARKAGRPLM